MASDVIKPTTIQKRVEMFYQLFPEADNETLYSMFPEVNSGTLKAAKRRYIEKLTAKRIHGIEVPDVEELMEGPINPPIPEKQKPGRKAKQQYSEGDELPPPTGRVWFGDECKLDSSDVFTWYKPTIPKPPLYFNWYDYFINRECNFPVPAKLGKCHKEWGSILDSGSRKLVFLCPRDHFKSEYISNGYIIRDICDYPKNPIWNGIIQVAWDKDLAEMNMLRVTQNLMENPYILSFYGGLIDEDRKNTQKVKYFKFQPPGARDPGLKCLGFNQGKITGGHPHLANFDDIQLVLFTDTMMKKFKFAVNQKVLPAIGKLGRLVITGTIKGTDATNDGYLWLEGKPTFEIHRYKAIVKGGVPPMADLTWEIKQVPQELNGQLIRDWQGKVQYKKEFIVHVKNRHEYKCLYKERYAIEDLMSKMFDLLDEGKNIDAFYSEYQLEATDPAGKIFQAKRIRPMEGMPFPEFHNIASFYEYRKRREKHLPVVLWVDPGGEGEKSHGMSIVVMSKYQGCWFLLDCVTIKKGIPETAKVIGKLMERWHIDFWGVEGNWTQKSFVGKTLREFLKTYLKSIDKMWLYKPPTFKNNVGEKLQRIKTGFSTMLGLEGMDYTFFANENAQHYDIFKKQVKDFGVIRVSGNTHEFDAIDSIVSADLHLLGHNPGMLRCASRR
jgi:hypothetical protein